MGRIIGGLVAALLLLPTATAGAASERKQLSFRTSDGTELYAFVDGEAPLAARPTIVEFSTYAPTWSRRRPGFNALEVHVRGTGRSGGQWDIAGAREQQDARELLAWACEQPWSNGVLGLTGESSPAISAYTAMRAELPCVEAAVLWAGATDLYRDIAYVGGIPNAAVSAGFTGLVAAPAVQTFQTRPQDPGSHADLVGGFVGRAADYLAHPAEDEFWIQRAFTSREPGHDVPILANTGFFDIEAPSAYGAYRETRAAGSQLRVLGAHDVGFPGSTEQWIAETNRWFEHYLLGIDNGIDEEPSVQLWVPDGGLDKIHAGSVEKVAGDDWPLPGTRWRSLYLDPAASGSATSLNDGSLSDRPPPATSMQPYPFAPSNPVATDPNNIGGLGVSTSLAGTPVSTDLNDAERTGLTFTTPPLAEDLLSVGPAALEVTLASSAPETDIFALITDVSPDGASKAIAVGRLRTSFPGVDLARSLRDKTGAVVEPYADFSAKAPATPGTARRYQVAFWPVGNRFRAGHRVRLDVVGTPATALASPAGVNILTLGGEGASRLLLPELRR